MNPRLYGGALRVAPSMPRGHTIFLFNVLSCNRGRNHFQSSSLITSLGSCLFLLTLISASSLPGPTSWLSFPHPSSQLSPLPVASWELQSSGYNPQSLASWSPPSQTTSAYVYVTLSTPAPVPTQNCPVFEVMGFLVPILDLSSLAYPHPQLNLSPSSLSAPVCHSLQSILSWWLPSAVTCRPEWLPWLSSTYRKNLSSSVMLRACALGSDDLVSNPGL